MGVSLYNRYLRRSSRQHWAWPCFAMQRTPTSISSAPSFRFRSTSMSSPIDCGRRAHLRAHRARRHRRSHHHVEARRRRLRAGARVEHDRPVDTGTFNQTYVDARARYLYSLAEVVPALEDVTTNDVSGWLTLGAFLVNPTYAARPDNTGNALLRYGVACRAVAVRRSDLDRARRNDVHRPRDAAPSPSASSMRRRSSFCTSLLGSFTSPTSATCRSIDPASCSRMSTRWRCGASI